MHKNKLSTLDLLPIIQMVLRLFGVYFVVIGGASLVEDMVTIIAQWRIEMNPGREALLDYLNLPRLWGSLVYFGAGIYLMVGGNWVINNVFLPAPVETPDEPSQTNIKE